MTRIVAGDARSVRLAVPSQGTRPTSDRVREALFSALAARGTLRGASVLDLFAGSGALGLEAVSRGARRAALVDSSRQAIAVCRDNAAAVTRSIGSRRDVSIDAHCAKASSYLRSTDGCFDVVFIDPPYRETSASIAALLDQLADHLDPEAIVIVERERQSEPIAHGDRYNLVKTSAYGQTSLIWLTPAAL